jgi:hypothetical protein
MMPLPLNLKIGLASSAPNATQVSSKTQSKSPSKEISSSNKENIVVDLEKSQEKPRFLLPIPSPDKDDVSQSAKSRNGERDKTISDLEQMLDLQLSEALGALSNIESKSSAAAARMTSFDQQAKEYLAEDTDGECSTGKLSKKSGRCIIELGTDDSVRAVGGNPPKLGSVIEAEEEATVIPGRECVTDIDTPAPALIERCFEDQVSHEEFEALRRMELVNEKASQAAARVNELEHCHKGLLPEWMANELIEEHSRDRKSWIVPPSTIRNSERHLSQRVEALKQEVKEQTQGGMSVQTKLAEMEGRERTAKERIAQLEMTMKRKEMELQQSMKTADGLIRQLKEQQEKRDADLEQMKISLEESATRSVEQANFYGCVTGGSASSFFSGSWFGFTSFCRSNA